MRGPHDPDPGLKGPGPLWRPLAAALISGLSWAAFAIYLAEQFDR